MTALALFGSTFVLVFFLGLQTINVARGHYLPAFLTSIGIGISNLILFKLAPDANGLEIIAFLMGGPFGVVAAMWSHTRIAKMLANNVSKKEPQHEPR